MFHSSVSCVSLLDGPRGQSRRHGLVQLAGQRVVERPHRREPGRQPASRAGSAAAARSSRSRYSPPRAGVTRQQQVSRPGPAAGPGHAASSEGSTMLRSSGAAGPGRAGSRARPGPAAGPAPGRPAAPPGSGGPRAACLPRTRTIRPPAAEALLARPVPGPQLGAQHLAHQMVVAEAGPLIIERHQEQVGRVDAAQQRRRVLPAR